MTVQDAMGAPTNLALGSPDTITLRGVIRDFTPDHPDFEMQPRPDVEVQTFPQTAGFGVVKGIVGKTLVNQKPVYVGGTPVQANGQTLFPWTNGKDLFDRWYNNNDPQSTKEFSLPLRKIADPTSAAGFKYQFDSDIDFKDKGGFFPIDGELLQKDLPQEQWPDFKDSQGRKHNFHFTFEANCRFTYQGGEEFKFTGDDDLWIFINNQLVIDLGGVHARTEASVKLDEVAAAIGLVKGNTYRFDLFYAERHTTEANFKVETSIVFLPTVSIQATKPDAKKAGPVPGEFTIKLDRPAPTGGVTVNYDVNPSPLPAGFAAMPVAKEGTDFTLVPSGRSILIPEGKNEVKIQVSPQGTPPLGDSKGCVCVVLKPDANHQLGQSSALVTIADRVLWKADIVALSNANKVSRQNGAFKVTLNGPAPAGGLTVAYKIVPGDANAAVAGVDFTPLFAGPTGAVTFPQGQREAVITVVPTNSVGVAADKPLVLQLLPGDKYQPNTATATIRILDQAKVVVLPTVHITASGDARRPATNIPAINGAFTINCPDKPAGQSMAVTFQVSGVKVGEDCDMPGVDPNTSIGSVTLAANQTSVTIPVTPKTAKVFGSVGAVTVVATLRDDPSRYRLGTNPARLNINPAPSRQP